MRCCLLVVVFLQSIKSDPSISPSFISITPLPTSTYSDQWKIEFRFNRLLSISSVTPSILFATLGVFMYISAMCKKRCFCFLHINNNFLFLTILCFSFFRANRQFTAAIDYYIVFSFTTYFLYIVFSTTAYYASLPNDYNNFSPDADCKTISFFREFFLFW